MPLPSDYSFARQRVLVMGLGRFGGGIGVSQWLAQQGALVTVTDSAPAEELSDSIAALAGLPITFKLGGHDPADFTSADLIVVNPAVDRAKSPEIQAALAKNIPTTTEMNLFLERCQGRTIGITGSVGKSTTTALVNAALTAGLNSKSQISNLTISSFKSEISDLKSPIPRIHLGGNIGKSLLADLPNIHPTDYVVLELSSFMLEETPHIHWSPHIAVVTNVVPNHLDRHGTMANYSAAKQNILRFQKPDDIAILNADHDLVARWVRFAKGRIVKFTTRGPAEKRLTLLLPGDHNQSNAAAALAVVDAVIAELGGGAGGVPFDRSAAVHAIEQFPGLVHRLQLVHSWEISAAPKRVVRFFNDSKATTPEAAMTAVQAFAEKSAIFIVGGFERQTDYSEFEELLARRAAGVIGIGETGRAIISHLAALAPHLPAHYAQTLESALPLARDWSRQHATIQAIVLSPASASWDQYANYEVRGDLFAQLATQTNAE